MELNYHDRHASIDELMAAYKGHARRRADKVFTQGAHWREQDRQEMYTSVLEFRVRMLLEEIATSAPHLFTELLERVAQKEPA